MLSAEPYTNSYTAGLNNSAQATSQQTRTEIAAADYNLSEESFLYIDQQITTGLEQNTELAKNTEQTISAADFKLEEISFAVDFEQLVEPTLTQSLTTTVDLTTTADLTTALAQESVEFSEAGFGELMTDFRAEPVAGINTEHLVAELGGLLEGALTLAAFAPAAAAVVNSTRDAITGEQSSTELYPELESAIAA